MTTENVLLKISGDSSSGKKSLLEMHRAMEDMGTTLQRLKERATQTSRVQQALESVNAVLQRVRERGMQGAQGLQETARAAQSAGQGGQEASGGLGGLLGMLAKLNPTTIAAGLGLAGLVKGLSALKKEIVGVVNNAQTLDISLQSLAARELVKAGYFENATEAMEAAEVGARHLRRELQILGLVSPFENSTVVETFRLGMAYGFASDQAMTLTRASLNMASGLGLTGQDLTEINRVFGQIRSTGRLLTQDLNQLRGRGIDLAGMLRDQLGISVEQFNAGLQTGKYNMDDLLNVFAKFADTNFANAGERMARTIVGIKSTLQDLKEIALTQFFKPAADRLTAVAAEGLDWLADLITQSGVLEKAGQRLAGWVDRAITFGRSVVSFFRDMLQAANQAADGTERFIGVFSLGAAGRDLWTRLLSGAREVSANLREVGALVATYVAPAFQWLKRVITESDFTPLVTHLRDAVATALAVINGFILSIRNLLEGKGRESFNPLRDALIDVLAWLALTWDRFLAGAIAWGWNLVVQIANGIYSAARSVLTSALTYLGNAIGAFLKPGSPPKRGPLSHIVEWGRGVINTFLQSFQTADFRSLQESLSPIKKALQDAVSVGTISEPEFVQIYGQARDLVAELWATFRESGRISEAVLGQISSALGEGGADMIEYLRYQLQYQQALDRLANVKDKVAAAAKAGFIPAQLQKELEAAEAEAEAAKDKLDWQKELLNVQQESVDLQLQLVKALEKLAGALDKVTKLSEVNGRAGGLGELAAPELPFTTNLPTSAPLKLELEGGEELQSVLDGVSADFELMRGKVEAWLKLPVEDKIRDILVELGQVTGVDFAGMFDKLREFDLGESVKTIITSGIDALRRNSSTWAQSLGSGLFDLFMRALAALSLRSALWRLKVRDILAGLMRNFLNALAEDGATWGQSLGTAIGTVWGLAITFCTQTLPEWRRRIEEFPQKLIMAVAEWIAENGPAYARQWADAVKDYVLKWINIIKNEGPGWAKGLVDFAREYVLAFVVAFLENAPEDLKETALVGLEFVNKIKQGIDEAWDMVTYARDKIRQWVNSILTSLAVWVARLIEAGATIIGKLKEGINKAWDLATWIGGKFLTLVSDLMKGAGDTFAGLLNLGKIIVEKIKAGVDTEWDLPGWMSGLLVAWWNSLLTGDSSGWLNLLGRAGEAIVNNLKAGIQRQWENFKNWWKRLLEGLTGPLPGSEPRDATSPLRGLGKRGAALVENFAAGIDFSVVQRQLQRELTGMQRMLATTTPIGGGINVYLDGGMQFPNVRSGRDAERLKDALRRQSMEAAMRGRV